MFVKWCFERLSTENLPHWPVVGALYTLDFVIASIVFQIEASSIRFYHCAIFYSFLLSFFVRRYFVYSKKVIRFICD